MAIKAISKTLFAICVAPLAALVFALFIAYRNERAENQRLRALASLQQDSLRLLNLQTLGDSLLLTGNDALALLVYERADSLFGKTTLSERARGFVQRRDSAEKIQRDEVADLRRRMRWALRAALDRQAELNSRDAQLSQTRQELARFKNDLAELKRELEEKSRAVGKLEFKTSRGATVYYVGEIKDGKADGFGSGSFSTGSLYVGTWKDNRKHGTGRYVWKDGSAYEGDYVSDQRDGVGTYFFATGEKYVGEWKNDKRDGKGALYDKNGNILLEGTWKNDEFVREK